MHDGGAEVTDKADFTCGDGVDERIALARVLQDLARDGAAVDRVDLGAVGRVDEPLAVELEAAHVHETSGNARTLEGGDKAVEIAEHTRLGKVGHADVGHRGAGKAVGAVHLHERLDPAVEELELLHTPALREAGESRGLLKGAGQHQVARHGARPVGVELAELVRQVILVEEQVKAAHGQLLVVAARQKDEALHFLGEAEQVAVGGVVHIVRDNLGEDGVDLRAGVLQEGHVGGVEEIGHVGEARGSPMHPDVGVLHEIESGATARQVAVEVADGLDVRCALFFHVCSS